MYKCSPCSSCIDLSNPNTAADYNYDTYLAPPAPPYDYYASSSSSYDYYAPSTTSYDGTTTSYDGTTTSYDGTT